MLLSPKLLHNIKSIFCQHVQFFYLFYHLNLVIAKLGDGKIKPLNNLVKTPNNLKILLVIENLDKIYQKNWRKWAVSC